ncbi:Ubiquitin-like protein [Gracilaria domingensis]|nr:Ubiquitin-like protein [Gracilaria domingensis]
MGCLLSKSEVAGSDLKHNPAAYLIKVRLPDGQQIPCYVIPSDSIQDVRNRIERRHGIQPDVYLDGKMVKPPILANWNNRWIRVKPEATMQMIGLQKQLWFAYSTDFTLNMYGLMLPEIPIWPRLPLTFPPSWYDDRTTDSDGRN